MQTMPLLPVLTALPLPMSLLCCPALRTLALAFLLVHATIYPTPQTRTRAHAQDCRRFHYGACRPTDTPLPPLLCTLLEILILACEGDGE